MKAIRKIVHINEEKCNGCGACVPSCAEGALRIINGKAKIVSEKYCDGLGACLGECPQGAITIEERPAENFDEGAVVLHLAQQARQEMPCACPSTTVQQFDREVDKKVPAEETSMLRHWPVQLTLVSPGAPFLENADVVLAADCVPFACAGFHSDFLEGNSLLVACPKLDNFEAHLVKLTEVLKKSNIKSITIVRMEVPCCSGLTFLAREAARVSNKNVPLGEVIIGVDGKIKQSLTISPVEMR